MKEPTRAPIFACLYPGLCDIARKHGYALAIHGTVASDLDLIAVPWIEAATDAVTVKDALMHHIGACGYADMLRRDTWRTEEHVQQILANERAAGRVADDVEIKPHGRMAWNLYMHEGTKVDLSVLPILENGQEEPRHE